MLIRGATVVAACFGSDDGDLAAAASVAVTGIVADGSLEVDATPREGVRPDPARYAFGRVGARVQPVTIEFTGGHLITASCGSCALGASWAPGSDPAVIRGYDAGARW